MNCSRQHCEYEPECAFRQSGGRMDVIDGDCPFYDRMNRWADNPTQRKVYNEGIYDAMIVSHFGFNRAYTGMPLMARREEE